MQQLLLKLHDWYFSPCTVQSRVLHVRSSILKYEVGGVAGSTVSTVTLQFNMLGFPLQCHHHGWWEAIHAVKCTKWRLQLSKPDGQVLTNDSFQNGLRALNT